MKIPNWTGKLEGVYIFHPEVIQLTPEVDRGRLVYRSEGSKED